MQIRKISAAEVETFRRVNNYAFGRWTDDDLPAVAFLGVEPNASLAVFVDEQIVSVLRNIPFEQSVRGVLKEMGGVASVSSYPEARRKGYVHQLMLAALGDMQAKGQVVSSLYPFRDTFYERYGYVTANSSLKVTLPMDSLNHYVKLDAPTGSWTIERLPATAVVEQELHLLFDFWREVTVPAYSGYALRHEDDPAAWQEWFKNQHLVFIRHAGQIQAAARYQLDDFAENGKLVVHEMAWRNLTARDYLLSFLAAHGEQAYEISLHLPQDSCFQRWISQPKTAIGIQIDRVPLMVRVVDVVGALTGVPVGVGSVNTAVDTLLIAVTDEHCPWNNGQFRLTAVDGRLQVEPAVGQNPVDAQMDIRAVSALAFGARSASEAAHLGWLTAVSPDTLALLETWFPELTLFNPNPF